MCPRNAVGYLKTALQLEKVMGAENPETHLVLALTLLDMAKADEASEYIALIEEKMMFLWMICIRCPCFR